MTKFEIIAQGKDFDPEEYASTTSLEIAGFRKNNRINSLFIALGDGYNLSTCAQDRIAVEYLTKNRDELIRLVAYPGVEYVMLGLERQQDVRKGTRIGFYMGLSMELMALLLEIGITPHFYVSIDSMNVDEEESDAEADPQEETICQHSGAGADDLDEAWVERPLPPVLVTTSFMVEEGLNQDQFGEVTDKLSNSLRYSLTTICKSVPKVKYLGLYSYTYLDPKVENCFKCEHCGRWTTNVEKDHAISGLPDGLSFEGMYICTECRIWKHDPHCGWADKE